MNVEMKRLLSYLGRFLLTHFIWIVPVIVFLWSKQTILWAIFLPSFVTLIFLSWQKKRNEEEKCQELSVVKSPKLVTFLYYISIFIFLMLTGVATYEGINKVFGFNGRFNQFFALSFAIGIPLTLFCITLIVKNRKTPAIILSALMLYLLFDGLTALPFNFLFFYNHLTISASIEQDNNRFIKVINACDSVIAPKIVHSDSVIHQMKLKTVQEKKGINSTFDDNLRQTVAAYNLKIAYTDNDSLKRVFENQKNNAIKVIKPVKIQGLTKPEQDIFVASQNDSVQYNDLKIRLDSCRTYKDRFDRATNFEEKLQLSNDLKNRLEYILAHSNNISLLAYRNELRPYIPSSIQSIKHFYSWLGETLLNIPSNNKDFSLVREERRMLTIISLTTSIIIDILPLLLSFLFVIYNKND